MLAIVAIALSLMMAQDAYAHHKSDHDKGPPEDKGKPDDVPKGPKGKDVKSTSIGGSCARDSILVTSSDRAAKMPRNWGFSRCVIVDDTPPKIQEQFITPSGKYQCAKVTDDVGVRYVFINSRPIPRWAGSYNYYCNTTQNLNDGKINYGTNSMITRNSQSVNTYSKINDEHILKLWSIVAIDMGYNIDTWQPWKSNK